MNGVGKTTLLEIIDFCLGSNIDKKSYLKKIKQIETWTFSMDMDLFNSRYIISRCLKNPSRIYIEGDLDKLPEIPQKEGDKYYFKLKDWRNLLGVYLFDLAESETKFPPTFRSLISYFIRKQAESYNEPIEHHKKQQNWNIQINTAFLLGLNYEHASSFQILKENMKHVKNQLKDFDESSIGKLETQKINLENELNKKNERLSTFKITKTMTNLKIMQMNYLKNFQN